MSAFEIAHFDKESNEQRFQYFRRYVFLNTFINYAFSHFTRKAYTNIKNELLNSTAGLDITTLALMDSAFMVTYSGGSIITGMLGDRYSPVGIVSFGLIGSSLCLASMIVATTCSSRFYFDSAGTSSTSIASIFLVIQMVHGLFQSTGGPCNTTIMAHWYPSAEHKSRGLVYGLWTCHQYFGDVTAGLVSAWILDQTSIDWRWCLGIPAILNLIWAFATIRCLPNTPEERGIVTKALVEKLQSSASSSPVMGPVTTSSPSAISFMDALMLEHVLNYSIAFGFFKCTNYALFFGLPMILSTHFDSATASVISVFYSLGMCVGSVLCGASTDLMGSNRRTVVIAAFALTLCPILAFLAFSDLETLDVHLLLSLLVIMGALVAGPNNIITSAVSTDLAANPLVEGNASGTVTGIINGIGTATAAIGQLFIPALYEYGKQDGVGYQYVWMFLMALTLIGTACLVPKIRSEVEFDTTTSTSFQPSECQPIQHTTLGYESVMINEFGDEEKEEKDGNKCSKDDQCSLREVERSSKSSLGWIEWLNGI